MINPTVVDMLGKPASTLLETPPFSAWESTRSEEHDPKCENWYEFKGHGVEVISDDCDNIRAIFLHPGDGEALGGVLFSMSRAELTQLFGPPSASGPAVDIPRLGKRGPWVRFTIERALVHVQFKVDADEIEMITLIRPGTEP